MNQMNQQKVSLDDAATGEVIRIRGKVTYSHIVTPYTQEQVDQKAIRSKANGNQYPTTVPFSEIEINEVSVIAKNTNQPTIGEHYVYNNIYADKKTGSAKYRFENKGTIPPKMIQLLTNENNVPTGAKEIPLVDLVQGIDVTLVLRVYQPKNQPKKGLSITAIIVNEKAIARDFGGATSTINSVLNELGIEGYEALPEEESGQATQNASVPEAKQEQAFANQGNQGFGGQGNQGFVSQDNQGFASQGFASQGFTNQGTQEFNGGNAGGGVVNYDRNPNSYQ